MGLVDKIGGGFKTNSVQDQAKWALDTLQRDYPQVMQLLNSQLTPQAQAELEAARAVTPGYNDLAVGELERIAPRAQAAQAQLDAAQAGSDVASLERYGKPAAEALVGIDRVVDPEFYATRAGLGGKYADALNALSPGLSAGQRAEVERGNARSGSTDASAVDTASRAMAFGQAGQAQVNNFVNAINSVSAALPALRSGLNPAQVALGRDSRTSPVMGAITPVKPPGGTAYNVGGNTWQSLLGMSQDNENRRAGKFKTYGDTFEQDSRSFSNIASGASSIAGCWVAREVYGNDNPRWRFFRVWLNYCAPAWLREIYMLHGPTIASFIATKPLLKRLVRAWMDRKIKSL